MAEITTTPPPEYSCNSPDSGRRHTGPDRTGGRRGATSTRSCGARLQTYKLQDTDDIRTILGYSGYFSYKNIMTNLFIINTALYVYCAPLTQNPASYCLLTSGRREQCVKLVFVAWITAQDIVQAIPWNLRVAICSWFFF